MPWNLMPSHSRAARTAEDRIPLARSRGVLERAEDAFRLSMIGAGGDTKVFWSNSLVGSMTTLAIVLLFCL